MPPDPTTVMADADRDLDDEQYDSADDEDFTLDQGADEDDAGLSSSDEEVAATEPAAKRRKTKARAEDAPGQDVELDSGDEAMIRRAKEKKQKREKKSSDDEDDEGGSGGFVRTRAMKMRVQEERRPLAKIDGSTIDIDALWAQMNAPDSNTDSTQVPEPAKPAEAESATDTELRAQEHTTQLNTSQEKPNQTQYPGEMVKIKRTYKFAGDVITEEKLVPRDSAEAKLFLSGGQDGKVVAATEDNIADGNSHSIIKFHRPLRKISRFDPNPTGLIKKSWEKQPLTEAGQEANARGPKINTVEKSRMDWAAYVDQAGISDELRVHSKAKEGFLGRMDFLDRVDAKREEERRNARLKGV